MLVAAAGLVLSATIASDASAQITYDHTSFLNGFYSDTGIWKLPYTDLQGATPVEYLAKTHALKSVLRLNVNRNYRWADQVKDVAPHIGTAEHHVLVAHSLGSLVARGIYIDSVRTRANISAIIAMAAPHEGTRLADSAYKARNFLLDVQRRVNDANKALNITADIILGISSVAAPTDPVHAAVYEGLSMYVTDWFQKQLLSLDDIAKLTTVPALADLQPGSTTISYLTSHADDAAIPRFNIVGSIPLKNAALHIKNSLDSAKAEVDYRKLVTRRDLAVDAFEACRVLGWAVLAMSPVGRRCAYAARVMKRVDDRWGRYVNGSEPLVVGGFTLSHARTVPFDGVVSNELSQYPGLTDATYMAVANGANHQNIYSYPAGLVQASKGMGAVGMLSNTSTPAMTVGITGPSSLASGSGGNWTASVSGGTPTYRYQWSGMLSGTASTVNGPGPGTLTLDVWDAAGVHGTASKVISTTTSCGTRRVC